MSGVPSTVAIEDSGFTEDEIAYMATVYNIDNRPAEPTLLARCEYSSDERMTPNDTLLFIVTTPCR